MSEVKVNKISPRTIGNMSEVKVNKITPTTNCGTVTLGDSGDTISIPAGVTLDVQGTSSGVTDISWDTTAKTAGFTAVAGNGYFVNTTSGAITVTLPATPSVGDFVGIKDYANTADTNNITIARNGSNIQGTANDFIISTEGLSIILIYVDATQGWVSTGAAQASDINKQSLIATGGTITTCGDYKIHTFTGPGTFCVSQLSGVSAENTVSYMVVAGGASGGSRNGGAGGGGAGGFREYKGPADCYTASPLNGNPGGTAVTVTATSYPISVGGGGAPQPQCSSAQGNAGSNSIFSSITSTGGGGGGAVSSIGPTTVGAAGGSGGGAGIETDNVPFSCAGAGNTPPVSPSQGNPGGDNYALTWPSTNNSGGGGGGAGAAGGNGSSGTGGTRGCGVDTSISGSSVNYGQGGGASVFSPGSVGGLGGNNPTPATTNDGVPGGTNTGGGGGAGGDNNNGGTSGAGGSGIVIIRYKYQ